MAQRSDTQVMILAFISAAAVAVLGATLLTALYAALRLALDAAFDFGSPKWPLIIAYVAPQLVVIAVFFLVFRRLSKLTEDQRNRVIDMNKALAMFVIFASFSADLAASLFLSKGLFLLLSATIKVQPLTLDVLAAALFAALYMATLYLFMIAVIHRRPQVNGQGAS